MIFTINAQAQTAAQDTTIHKVEMIPFGRFDFYTEFPASLIDSINHIDPNSSAYDAVENSLLNAFINQDSSKWRYSLLPKNLTDELQPYYTLANRKEPIDHYGLKIYQGFFRLAENMMVQEKVDGFLFFTLYKINKSHIVYSSNGKGSKRKIYSNHIVEAVLITRYGKYYASGRIEIKDTPHNQTNVTDKNLLLKSLKASYVALAENLRKKLKGFKEK